MSIKYKDFYSDLILENYQLAEKLYFKTEVLNERWKEFILKITNGDFTTKIIADIVADKVKNGRQHELIKKEIQETYLEAKNYDKNIFPIRGFSYDNKENINYQHPFLMRKKTIESFTQLPKMAARNLREDIRKPRDVHGFSKLINILEYIHRLLNQLNNRPEDIKNKMFRKIFSSDNQTLDDVARFLEEKENLIGGQEITKEGIIESVEEDGVDIVYNKNNVLILDIQSSDDMKKYGCNGLWCFTYGAGDSAEKTFDSYSTNGHVYLIIDFNEKNQDRPDFMHVLIKPISKNEYRGLLDYINKQTSFDFYNRGGGDETGEYKLYDLTNSRVDDAAWTIYTIARQDLEVFEVLTF